WTLWCPELEEIRTFGIVSNRDRICIRPQRLKVRMNHKFENMRFERLRAFGILQGFTPRGEQIELFRAPPMDFESTDEIGGCGCWESSGFKRHPVYGCR